MEVKHPFLIYNASAGSGKTFTLVKVYLKILFTSNQQNGFKNILALTFTNKAVAEMKERIVEMLIVFSNPDILENPTPMFGMLTEELQMDSKILHQKSQHILNTIAHNYAAFDISTIDKFNHRLIRTFAHDLKLPLNFEVELDTKTILAKAVDQLIDKAGTEKELTKILVDFAIEKADDDKSWDVSFDFNQIAQLLINENDIPYFEDLKDKSIEDFKALKAQLLKQIVLIETDISKKGQEALDLIVQNGLEFNNFSSSYLPKHFLKLAEGNSNVNLDQLTWQKDLLEGNPLYPKRVDTLKMTLIDRLQPILSTLFQKSKESIVQFRFLKNVLNNITPLSVLNAIYNSLQDIKIDEDLVLISEFNSLINTEIKLQPAPFIYERIGEKYRHYFIDEFQDTSVKQWENLIPLIDNALSAQNLKGEAGTTMLVGDAKQAIYRWRGGKAEQFIDLYTKRTQPFHIEQQIDNLPTNYRSLETIVKFNNNFFKHLSTFAFSNPSHQKIYEASHQNLHLTGDGYVELSFLEFESEDKDDTYGQKVLEAIQKALENSFELRDICIIARKSKEGIALAEYLSKKGIPIISSESLLLKNSPEVQFLTSIIALASQPYNQMLKIEALSYLAEHHFQLEDKHQFFQNLVHLDAFEMFKGLNRYDLFFDFNQFLQQPFYEAVESAVRQFNLNKTSNAYIQFFLDEVLDYSQRYNAGFSDFTSHWDIKKEKLSITSPKGNNAVQIMTIHKSKGLEFPVVIFPYANQNIYFDMSPKLWFPVHSESFHGFSNVFINVNKDLEDLGTLGQTMYADYKAQLELDSMNLLYVVLTRAVEQLYIVSEYDVDKKNNEKLSAYSGLFINYLKSVGLYTDSEKTYSFGQPTRVLPAEPVEKANIQERFISVAKENHDLHIVTNAGYLWDTEQEAAIEKGNLVHLILSKVKTKDDLDLVFEDFENSGDLNSQQSAELKPIINNIVHHEQLKAFFMPGLTVYNERDILTSGGLISRPDRIVLNNQNEAVIIDYKTGSERPTHQNQIMAYQVILEEMGYNIVKRILVYINSDIHIKEF
ncbi:UvrD-helicase domain-containing protein [Gelidibacter maritimus]|uniref:DNA 3'-5' helicase n=1 Tax=Gelidibacter maritimus TaxID=2761487 RepID=A0A7W2M333_9FLAO|nr:UvrD-helicase domain-containing protein [Gelidibacter maritimus]MBA6151818.1 UvrD-helicase domain-containing protein [Gelidibacter maritimus]